MSEKNVQLKSKVKNRDFERNQDIRKIASLNYELRNLSEKYRIAENKLEEYQEMNDPHDENITLKKDLELANGKINLLEQKLGEMKNTITEERKNNSLHFQKNFRNQFISDLQASENTYKKLLE